jgi:hypothetical protein
MIYVDRKKGVERNMKIANLLLIYLVLLSTTSLPADAQQFLEGSYATAPIDGGVEIKKEKYRYCEEGNCDK